MTTQMEPSNNSALRKIAAILLFLLLGITLAFSQENELISNGWWNPIFKKHNIDLKKFNYKNTFDMGMNDTINNLWLEMGVSDSLTERNVPFRNAIIISQGPDQTYWITTSEYARHDIDNNLLILRNGQMVCYDFNSKNVVPTDSASFQEMSIDIKINSIRRGSKN